MIKSCCSSTSMITPKISQKMRQNSFHKSPFHLTSSLHWTSSLYTKTEMISQKSFTFLQVVLTLALALQVEGSDESDTSKRTQCGGTLTADADSLIFPGEGDSILPGEVCVWTLHLESTNDFRFNFQQFNSSSSTGSDCEGGGMRLYSISNLVPSDRIESYT
jgi:hypothetical protein